MILALVLASPVAAFAQTAPAADTDLLASLTNGYFNAIQSDNVTTLANTISPAFHTIGPDRKRHSFEEFMREVSEIYFISTGPLGTTVKINATAITPTGATETVDTLRWYMGGINPDPMSGPMLERIQSVHELNWIKSSDGRWLLEEDHITSARSRT